MMEGSDPAAILREIQSLARASHVPVRLVTANARSNRRKAPKRLKA